MLCQQEPVMNLQNLLSIAKPASQHRGIVLLSARELDKMRTVGKLAAQLLNHLEPLVKPGVSTQELNDEADRWMKDHGAISATLGYAPPNHPPYPGSICTSINEVVCHGIPSPKQILKDGDILNIDVTPILEGYHGDTSRMFMVGEVSEKARKLVEVTKEAMMRGIAEVKPGARVGDIGAAIQEYAEANGFSVVRDMVGHGVGRVFHTEPQIPHFGKRGTGVKLRSGMVFTIEPMLNEGTYELKFLSDRWTVITKDKKLSAQFEHTIAVTDDGYEILTLP
ncbi:type I methionyl aminopeptidase [Leptolyngbya sp. NIES-2104]|uniref:type I methionyl aminopeptidase n=1 Tax=Leptolyngbya sp. NIES-2104 TaxID=1552121 RepID=UPI0006EC4F8A|nr:type I methionyl aminopeptidase [Leptolyngbya sp. NIES-2104]GAP93702.1 methionine aminopeptidase [Leptolyngbya sp. NIES-2104]